MADDDFSGADEGQTNGSGTGSNGDAEEAIAQLFDDYQAGRLGSIPHGALGTVRPND